MVKKKMNQEEELNKGETQTTDNKDNKTIETNAEETGQTTVSQQEAEKEIASVQEKLAEMQDRYLRLSAEFDNFRKRTLREKMELSKYAAENLFLKILPVMDDFDRAISHMDEAQDCVAMKSGIDLIYNKFAEFLKQNGVKEVETSEGEFNVDLHDAVAKTSAPEEMRGRIIEVIQKGYYLNDKVIRHSKVVVGE
jgi:molecular chaperone GrpE